MRFFSSSIGPRRAALEPRRAALAIILLIAAALRLDGVRQPLVDVFSWRQSSTAMMADNFYRTDPNIFFPEVNWTGPGPNYQGREFQSVSYLASIFYRIFGQRDWIGRGVSIAFSVWGVFALYQLTRRAWDEERALAVALMYALLPGAIFIDRSFLPDGAMLALTVTTLWMYLAHLQTGRRNYLIAAAVIGVWAFLTKLPGIVALAPMAYATVSVLRKRHALDRRALRPILLALILGMLPVAAYYAWAIYLGTHYPPYHVAGSGNWIWATGIDTFAREKFYLESTFKNLRWWLWTPPMIALASLGFVIPPTWRARRDDATRDVPAAAVRAPWLFHLWLVGCVGLYVVGARELSENPWNLHVFNIAAAAMAGNALVALTALIRRGKLGSIWRTTLVIALGAVILIRGHKAVEMMRRPRAEHSYLLGLALRDRTAPGDLVVTIADDVGDPIAIYYSGRRGWVFPPAHMPHVWKPWNRMPADAKQSIAMFEDLRQRGAKWLGIVTGPRDDTPGREHFWIEHPELIAHINATCELVEKSGAWVLYRIKSPH